MPSLFTSEVAKLTCLHCISVVFCLQTEKNKNKSQYWFSTNLSYDIILWIMKSWLTNVNTWWSLKKNYVERGFASFKRQFRVSGNFSGYCFHIAWVESTGYWEISKVHWCDLSNHRYNLLELLSDKHQSKGVNLNLKKCSHYKSQENNNFLFFNSEHYSE